MFFVHLAKLSCEMRELVEPEAIEFEPRNKSEDPKPQTLNPKH